MHQNIPYLSLEQEVPQNGSCTTVAVELANTLNQVGYNSITMSVYSNPSRPDQLIVVMLGKHKSLMEN